MIAQLHRDAIGRVHTARSGDGVVMLDIDDDAYSCCYDPEATVQADSGADALVVKVSGDHRRDAAWRKMAPVAQVRIGARDVALFVKLLGRSTFRFRRLSFARLLDSLPSHHLDATADPIFYAMIVARFERLCLFLPVRIQCLFRSYFLLHWLHAHRLDADWVFGATLFPFRAHCWLAEAGVLLGESAERIDEFSVLATISKSAT